LISHSQLLNQFKNTPIIICIEWALKKSTANQQLHWSSKILDEHLLNGDVVLRMEKNQLTTHTDTTPTIYIYYNNTGP